MKLLQDRFETKEPHYPNVYRGLIERLARKKEFSTSDRSDTEQFERGQAFGTFYECYMYALMVGIRANNRLPFDRGQGTKFRPISDWRPKPMTQYIFMSLLALCEFEFDKIEVLSEIEANEIANDLLHLMEEYARGGFEIIDKKMRDDGSYFENTINVVGFLNQIPNKIDEN